MRGAENGRLSLDLVIHEYSPLRTSIARHSNAVNKYVKVLL